MFSFSLFCWIVVTVDVSNLLYLEPDNEDDPNLLVEREKLETSWKNLQEIHRITATRQQIGARNKRFLPLMDNASDELEGKGKYCSDDENKKQESTNELRYEVKFSYWKKWKIN